MTHLAILNSDDTYDTEACDVPGCPARYGLGDHDHYPPCFLCRRDTDSTSVRVDYGATVETVCAICWEKRDEDYLDERLDMTDG